MIQALTRKGVMKIWLFIVCLFLGTITQAAVPAFYGTLKQVQLKEATIAYYRFGHIMVIGAKAGGKKTVVPQAKYFNMLSDASMSPSVAIKTLLFPPTAGKQADAYLKIVANLPQEKMNGVALKAQERAVDSENNGPGIWDQLPNIKNKTLIMNGTDDVLTPVQNAVMIASSIPAAWLVQIQGAGHGVLFQEPEFIGDLVELFLSS